VALSGEVEGDEVCRVAGHKGQPEAVVQRRRWRPRRRLKGERRRGTLEKEKPPILGMIQRDGEGVIGLLANVQQQPLQLLRRQTIQSGTLIFTDEYAIDNQQDFRFECWKSKVDKVP
jgi:hypothetical protein